MLKLIDSNFAKNGGFAKYDCDNNLITVNISDVKPQYDDKKWFLGTKMKTKLVFENENNVNDFLKNHPKFNKDALIKIEEDAKFGYNQWANNNF